ARSGSEVAVLYQWLREGTNVPGATTATYKFLTSVSDNNSHWSLVARTAEGGLATTSSVATITVLNPIFETGWAVMEYWTGQAGASHDALLPFINAPIRDPAFTMAGPAFEARVNNE